MKRPTGSSPIPWAIEGPLAYRINDAVTASGLCRSQLYNLMRAGTLPYVEVGKVRMIRANDLRKLLKIEEPSRDELLAAAKAIIASCKRHMSYEPGIAEYEALEDAIAKAEKVG